MCPPQFSTTWPRWPTPSGVRMLLPLERHELTVSEFCSVLQLPQSTVSRHLKTLADDGWVVSRRDGTSRFYGMALEGLDPGARQLWPVIREQLGTSNGTDQDERRLQSVLRRRRSKSEAFFSSASGQWDRLRVELFGERVPPDGPAVAARRAAGGRRPRVRHRADERVAGAARGARDCRGWLGRHAAGRAHATAGPGQRGPAARATSRHCRSTTASSTRRLSRSCSITSRSPAWS